VPRKTCPPWLARTKDVAHQAHQCEAQNDEHALLEDDAAMRELDFEKRMEIAREIMAELQDDMAGIPLFAVNLPFVVGPKVGGWSPIPNLDDMSNLDTVVPRQ
jgi:hypothetical protein